MSLTSRIIEWIFKLPSAITRDVVVERGLSVPMPDGTTLVADRYYQRGFDKLPTILVRTPYSRTGVLGILVGHIFAERGFQVLFQNCRGTFGSGGVFDPFRNEQADGLATLAWLRQQSWFSGELATFGFSYLGFVQWAIAPEAGLELRAMTAQVTSSDFRDPTYWGESFGLDTSLTWVAAVSHQEKSLLKRLSVEFLGAGPVRSAAAQLPICGADQALVGKSVPFFQDWLTHNAPGDAWWQAVNFSDGVSKVTAPVLLIGGWYDVFMPQTIADYERLRRDGKRPYLTIGPWFHTSPGLVPVLMRESLSWLRAHLHHDRSGLRDAPVRLFVMGAGEWMEFPDWPPPGYPVQGWYLQPDGGLHAAGAVDSEPDQYRYDPADPTPAIGGSSLSKNAGRRDNRALEARLDVLCYTSPPLDRDLEVIGPVTAELYVQSSLAHTDFFVRLCDVTSSGKSLNVCDGLVRLSPDRPTAVADGCHQISVALWPTAYRFKRRHRIRVQVSSGAHPRFMRNLGSGEPLATGTKLVAADQRVYHDRAHPSAIFLPVKG